MAVIYSIILLLLLATGANAERAITLPFSETLDADDYSDLVWVTGDASHTHLLSGCWSGGCAKFVPPNNCATGGYSGLGAFILNSSPTQLNVRFILKIGSTWQSTASSCAGEGYGDKLLIMETDPEGTRPMIGLLSYPWGDTPTYYTACVGIYPGYLCEGGESVPNGTETFKIENYVGQWVAFELQANIGATNKLYIWTQDGLFNGLYLEVATTTSGTFNDVQIIGGYYNQDHPSPDANTYFMIDDVVISETYIGPPSGFGSTIRTNAGVTFSGCSPH